MTCSKYLIHIVERSNIFPPSVFLNLKTVQSGFLCQMKPIILHKDNSTKKKKGNDLTKPMLHSINVSWICSANIGFIVAWSPWFDKQIQDNWLSAHYEQLSIKYFSIFMKIFSCSDGTPGTPNKICWTEYVNILFPCREDEH